MLVAKATGTGKTRWAVNQIYRMLKSGFARRVLFLVDRRALAAQAVRTFRSYEPEPGLKFHQIYEVFSQRFQKDDFDEDEKFDPTVLPQTYLTDPQPNHTFVYVCTIQRMAIRGASTEVMPFENWPEVCGSERLTGAMLDRLTHRVHILEANGQSYRLRQSKRRLRRQAKPEGQEPGKGSETQED